MDSGGSFVAASYSVRAATRFGRRLLTRTPFASAEECPESVQATQVNHFVDKSGASPYLTTPLALPDVVLHVWKNRYSSEAQKVPLSENVPACA